MKRVAIYAHFDPRGEVKRHVLHSLRRLREECDQVHFVSTARLPPGELSKITGFCVSAALRENVGFDFATWQSVLSAPGFLDDVDELVLTNSSVLGPMSSLRDAFEAMQHRPCDLWGMTDSVQLAWHLQSYFLVFRRSALCHPAFARFWASVQPLREKKQVIQSYEIGLSRLLTGEGMRAAALVEWDALRIAHGRFRRRWIRPVTNPASCLPIECLERGLPFVKVEAFRDNPGGVSLERLRRAMADRGYDPSLIEIDPSPTNDASRASTQPDELFAQAQAERTHPPMRF